MASAENGYLDICKNPILNQEDAEVRAPSTHCAVGCTSSLLDELLDDAAANCWNLEAEEHTDHTVL